MSDYNLDLQVQLRQMLFTDQISIKSNLQQFKISAMTRTARSLAMVFSCIRGITAILAQILQTVHVLRDCRWRD